MNKVPDIWFSMGELGTGMFLAFILGVVFGMPTIAEDDDDGRKSL